MRGDGGLFDLQKQRVAIAVPKEQNKIGPGSNRTDADNSMSDIGDVVAIEHDTSLARRV